MKRCAGGSGPAAIQVNTAHPWEFFEAAQTALLEAAPNLIFRRYRRLWRVCTNEHGSEYAVRVTAAWLHLTADRLGIRFLKGELNAAPTGLGILLTAAEDTRFPPLPRNVYIP